MGNRLSSVQGFRVKKRQSRSSKAHKRQLQNLLEKAYTSRPVIVRIPKIKPEESTE